MNVFFEPGHSVDEESLYLLGVPGQGNVGQMAIDAMLATLFEVGRAVLIGRVESEFLMPMYGYDSFHLITTEGKQESRRHVCTSAEGKEARVYLCNKFIALWLDSLESFGLKCCHHTTKSTLHSRRVSTVCGPTVEEVDFVGIWRGHCAYRCCKRGVWHWRHWVSNLRSYLHQWFHITLTVKFWRKSFISSTNAEEAKLPAKLSEMISKFPRQELPKSRLPPPSSKLSTEAVSLLADSMMSVMLVTPVDSSKADFPRGMTSARSLFFTADALDLSLNVLGLYCPEGDNRMQAKALASFVGQGVDLLTNDNRILEPVSWAHCFGADLKPSADEYF